MGKPIAATPFMEAPCPCPICGEWEELRRMLTDPQGDWSSGELICLDCYQERQEEEDE